MNLMKSLIFHDYLYSPKSWLHQQSSQIKMYAVILQLLILPCLSLQYIFIFFFFCFYLYRSVCLHKNLKDYCQRIIILFTFFLFISIQYNTNITNKRLVQIYPIYHLHNINNIFTKTISSYCLYLPISIIRLLSINLIYLLLMKFLLLTTNYEQLINNILNHFKYLNIFSISKLKFEIMISTQFLKVIFKQIEEIKIAYLIRNIKSNRTYLFKDNLLICFFFIKQFLINAYDGINYISNTLYSREINCQKLYVYNSNI